MGETNYGMDATRIHPSPRTATYTGHAQTKPPPWTAIAKDEMNGRCAGVSTIRDDGPSKYPSIQLVFEDNHRRHKSKRNFAFHVSNATPPLERHN
ncbi:hypothetical protein KIN20_029505 [Parelaphostrongylus tenuis]|uniref:Uncharacterized protein n=1 Tax=Parelaphostrongylus tenuis TaxID=148309 RepID=A0AAD5R2J6_PARTN|nr:hypothetical protein KIN20_029505 [Parelaphostrongylus tenuis]